MEPKPPDRVSDGSKVAVVLVLASLLFLRPNVLSVDYALVGSGLCAAAAGAALLADKNSRTGVPHAYSLVVVLLGIAYLWLAVNAAIFAPASVTLVAKGFATTVVTAGLVGVVLADPSRRRLIARGFIGLMLVACASYAVTVMAWLIAGTSATAMVAFPIAENGIVATLHFPFTATFGTQTVGGVSFPRLTGIGREPGWMSFYAGFAILIWHRVGRPHVVGYVLLLLGVLGPVSTAGFGAFAVVLALAWITRAPTSRDVFVTYISFLVKCAVLAGALGLAVFAPVLGFAAKGDFNQESLNDRSTAMTNGIAAILTDPLGGAGEGPQASITLVAALAPFGIPYVIAILAALLLPRLVHPDARGTTGPVALIVITLLLSQPPGDSTFVYVLAGLAYVLPARDSSGQRGPRGAHSADLVILGRLSRTAKAPSLHHPSGRRSGKSPKS